MITFTIIGWTLAILGIIATCYYAKKQMKKPEITHFSINSYNVGKGLHDDFDELNLTYNGEELQNEIQVLNGAIVNTGKKDITGLKNESDIRIILPSGCILKKLKIKKSSRDLEVRQHENNDVQNEINFDIDEKMMCGEGFEYTALIETTEEIRNLHRKINFKHRIPNTSEISNEYIGQQTQKGSPSESKFFPLRMNDKTMGFTSLGATVVFGILSLSLLFFSAHKVEYSVIDKATGKEYSLFMSQQSQLYISDNELVPFWDNEKITKAELDERYNISIKTNCSWETVNSLAGYLVAFLAFIYFVGTILFFSSWNKKKRIYHLLKQYEQE